jgi:hypothetical protein
VVKVRSFDCHRRLLQKKMLERERKMVEGDDDD